MIPKRIYNPAQLSPDELKASFVARHEKLESMLSILAEQKPGHPCQHVVLVGPRGMGKTTLGLRFLQEVCERPDLAAAWQPVPFPEESYDIIDLADFWIAALHHLARATKDERWEAKAEALVEDEADPQRQAAYALAALLEYHQDNGKRLILFVENLDLVLEQLSDEREVHALRAALMEHPEIMVVGSTNAVFDAIRSHGEPFYEFFRLIRLQGLDQEECNLLLETLTTSKGAANLAQNMDQESGRLETIRHLTGGNPRLLALACRMLIESPLGSAFEDLERLIDEQTPYFKASIEALPVQARRVFHCLASTWAPMLTKEVSAAAKLSSSHASAQLRQLKEKGYVREIHLRDEKRGRYEVADRFYNIYYVLRFSRPGRERLARLVSFLHDLFGATAMRSLYPTALEALRTNDMPAGQAVDWLVVFAGYVGRDTQYSERHQWWEKVVGLFLDRGIDLDALQQVEAALDAGEPIGEELSATRRGIKLALQGEWPDAASEFRKLTETSPDDLLGWVGIALTSDDSELLNRAIAALRQENDDASQSSHSTDPHFAWCISLAEFQALLTLGHGQEAAEVIFRRLGMVELAPAVLLECGRNLAEAGHYEQALSIFAQVAEFARPFHPWKSRAVSVRALLLTVVEHVKTGKAEECLTVSKKVLRLILTNDPPELKSLAIAALTVTATELVAVGRADEATNLLQRMSDYVQPVVRDGRRTNCAELLASAAFRSLTEETIEPKLAESMCKTATSIDQTCAAAWQGLAVAIQAEGSKSRQAEAEAHARRAAEHAPNNCAVLLTLSATLGSGGKLAEAIEVMEHALSAKEGVPDELLGGVAKSLVMLLIAGQAAKVKELMANANLSERLEAVWHAVRAELGESIEPLPAEVFEAVKEVRRRIAAARVPLRSEGILPSIGEGSTA